MSLENLTETRTISEYKDAVFMFQYMVNNAGATVTEDDFPALLRPFYWFSHDPLFEDVFEACRGAMPVIGGYIILKSREGVEMNEYPLRDVNRMAEFLSEYLDKGSISLEEDVESTSLITPCYSMEDEVKGNPDILSIDPVIAGKEKELRTNPGEKLKSILEMNPADRIGNLKERFSDISACKNCVYNIVRVIGKDILVPIEEHIYRMHPADQDFILHGLDAFPKNKEILSFFERFRTKNTYASLNAQVEKYASRVKKGVKTTGWET